jgi:hypothetical protein
MNFHIAIALLTTELPRTGKLQVLTRVKIWLELLAEGCSVRAGLGLWSERRRCFDDNGNIIQQIRNVRK